MITITRKEEVVFNQIKIFDVEYDGIIPLDALKKELCSGSFHEYDLVQVLNSLSNKNVVKFEDSNIKLLVSDKKINTVITHKLELKKKNFMYMVDKLELVNPMNVLKRGYSIMYSEDKQVSSVKKLKVSNDIEVKLYDGTVKANITSIEEVK